MTNETAGEGSDSQVAASTWFGALGQLPGYAASRPGLPRGVVTATHRWATANPGSPAQKRPAFGCPMR